MKNPKFIFAAVLAVVFCFAGYNLWGYFQEQQVIQLEKERIAEERRIEKEQIRAEAAERRAEKEARLEQERLEEEKRAEQRRIEEELQRQERLAAAEKATAERQRKKAEEQQAREAANYQKQLTKARSPIDVGEMPRDLHSHLRTLSPNYIRNEPQEFLGQLISAEDLGRGDAKNLIHRGTNVMMVAAGFTPNPEVQQAFLDIGMKVNDVNEAGFTPLMFAAAYNGPDVIKALVDLGADMSMTGGEDGMTAFHLALALNPDPAVTELFLGLGADLNAKTRSGAAPIILAAASNPNLEIVEILANRGADKSVYFENGKTAWGYVDQRINSPDGADYRSITSEVDARILKALEP